VEAEEASDISELYNVSMVPHFLFVRNGSVVDTLEGAEPAVLTTKITALLSSPDTNGTNGAVLQPSTITTTRNGKPAQTLQDRLNTLLSQHPVMLFMKGSKDSPKCGFSSRVVQVLDKVGADYGFFDILSNEDVRQGLKEYSQWPTYPQLYLNGELLGGHDTIMELEETGELKSELAKAGALKYHRKSDMIMRLEKLLHSEPVMLIMKGTPDEPQCGFSRKVVEALRKEGIVFGSFNILEDEGVRQGLKEYSNWPTYPQLYAQGELVGGCDIVLDMAESAELKSTVEEMVSKLA
jgi:Grx4 family monothiol glutaredoxin